MSTENTIKIEKQDIFKNIQLMPPQKLAEYILNKTVSVVELQGYDDYDTSKHESVTDAAWEIVHKANTVESYNQFIDAFPNSTHANEAELAIQNVRIEKDDEDWQKALTDDTVEAYQSYLNDYPNGKHREEARTKKAAATDKIRWTEVDKQDVAALEKFIQDNPNNTFVSQAKNTIAEIEQKEIKIEWDSVDKNSISALQDFMTKYPNTIYHGEAQQQINILKNRPDIKELKADIEDVKKNKDITNPSQAIYELISKYLIAKFVSIDDILDLIEDDHNIFDVYVIKELKKNGYIEDDDLLDIGIDSAFIDRKAASSKTTFSLATKPMGLEREATEVFFWGIPASGKTCALGAILSVTKSGKVAKSMEIIHGCQGMDYMTKLPRCFNLQDKVQLLPAGTPTDASYEMGFDLVDEKRRVHPITLYDFAGEMLECMYIVGTDGFEALKENQKKTYHLLMNILKNKNADGTNKKSQNRKIHFFVVEYGAEHKIIRGTTQGDLLDTATAHIKQTNVFENDTDAIYLIVTKADIVKASSEEERKKKLAEYINTYYKGFYNNLIHICDKHHINGSRVQILPFSLGSVCFQDLCKFDPQYATDIVKIILDRSFCEPTGLKKKIKDIFSK